MVWKIIVSGTAFASVVVLPVMTLIYGINRNKVLREVEERSRWIAREPYWQRAHWILGVVSIILVVSANLVFHVNVDVETAAKQSIIGPGVSLLAANVGTWILAGVMCGRRLNIPKGPHAIPLCLFGLEFPLLIINVVVVAKSLVG
jgi:hypothetical protein